MSYICNGVGNVFGGNLYGFIWKHACSVVCLRYVFGEYGKYPNSVNKNYFLWGTYGSNYIDSYA